MTSLDWCILYVNNVKRRKINSQGIFWTISYSSFLADLFQISKLKVLWTDQNCSRSVGGNGPNILQYFTTKSTGSTGRIMVQVLKCQQPEEVGSIHMLLMLFFGLKFHISLYSHNTKLANDRFHCFIKAPIGIKAKLI